MLESILNPLVLCLVLFALLLFLLLERFLIMSKKITVSFYDACLPDYFCGHHKPVLQIPLMEAQQEKSYMMFVMGISQGVINMKSMKIT